VSWSAVLAGPAARVPGRVPAAAALATLALAAVTAAIAALGHGAFAIPPAEVLAILAHHAGLADAGGFTPEQDAVLWTIRLPRVLLGALVGAGLALSGAVMQGLFRNPLADPALVGISAGASLAAATVIVLGATLVPGLAKALGAFTLPAAAFVGALAAATLVWALAHGRGTTSVAVMLLAGIAINAVAEAGIGLYAYIANDEQLRNMTFWRLGSLGGGTYTVLAALVPLAGASLIALARLAAPLNALALGEAEARHLGVDVQRLKTIALVGVALCVGALVAVTGLIFFVGLVAPHIVRLACGPDHRVVLPGAALLGVTLILGADLLARTAVAPAELPIGVVTALIGAPFFLALLLRARRIGEA
jgi:iron complex transport system permease protein